MKMRLVILTLLPAFILSACDMVRGGSDNMNVDGKGNCTDSYRSAYVSTRTSAERYKTWEKKRNERGITESEILSYYSSAREAVESCQNFYFLHGDITCKTENKDGVKVKVNSDDLKDLCSGDAGTDDGIATQAE